VTLRFSRWLSSADSIAIPVALALLVLITRAPFMTQYLYNWDSANFALGMRSFDVSLHQPHPPGYPYYVWSGGLLHLLFSNANTSLVLVSILLQMAAVIGMYYFAARLFSVTAGIASALLLTFSVTFWTYGELALAYSALATFSILTGHFAYQTSLLGKDRLLACAACYAAGTGFRPDLALFLAPLLLLACWRQPLRRVALGLTIAGGGILLWLIPTALLSGGFQPYGDTLFAYFGTDVLERYAPTTKGLDAVLINVRDTSQYLFYALYAEAALVVTGIALLLWQACLSGRQAWKGRVRWAQPGFFVVWVAPVASFYLLVHIGDPGYVFGFLPALLLASVGGWHRVLSDTWEQKRMLAAAGLTLVLLVNVVLFLSYQKPLMLWGLQARDVRVASYLNYVQSHDPESILVVSYDSYKQLRYYLPGYANSVWLDTTTPKRQVFPTPDGVQWVILIDPSVFALAQSLPAEAEFLPGENWAALLPVHPGQSLVYEAGRLRVEP